MGNKPGLPSVPRGLGAALTSYLQSLDTAVRQLTGQVRGSNSTSTNEVREISGVSSKSSVTSAAIASGAVSTEKISNGAVTKGKIAKKAITGEEIADGAIAAKHLSPAILFPKLAFQAGGASGGTIIIPGTWKAAPAVFLTSVTAAETPETIGPQSLREILTDGGAGTGQWQFEANGTFSWCAVGYVR